MHCKLSITLAMASSIFISTAMAMSPMERLGAKLYFDRNLSEPSGQACADCHLPSAAFADPDQNIPVSEGVIQGRFGRRNSPTATYTMFSPNFQSDEGGLFWDGRATGNILGDPLADQALQPFLNPVEMNNPSKTTVVRDAQNSDYGDLFRSQCGEADLSRSDQVDAAFDCIAIAIGTFFERTILFSAFTSKYDKYLEACIDLGGTSENNLENCAEGRGRHARTAGEQFFTHDEWRGLRLFVGDNNNNGVFERGEGAGCAECHEVEWRSTRDFQHPVNSPAWAPGSMVPPIFTEFEFENIGIPKSQHPLLRNNPVDFGLGGVTGDHNQNGQFKTSTIRNVGPTAPYGHNGFFDTLQTITHFYNTRDVASAGWDEPEVNQNLSDDLGNLGLSAAQEAQIAAFMMTLTDEIRTDIDQGVDHLDGDDIGVGGNNNNDGADDDNDDEEDDD